MLVLDLTTFKTHFVFGSYKRISKPACELSFALMAIRYVKSIKSPAFFIPILLWESVHMPGRDLSIS